MRAMRLFKWSLLGLLVVFVIAAAGWQLSKSRSFQLYGGLVTRANVDQRVVALTLDDGPTPEGTGAILPVLDSLGVRATFFVTGRDLANNPTDGRRIVQAGHALGNHSYSHRQMVLHSRAFVHREITQTDSLIRAAGWEGDIPFRPPYGKRLFVLPRYLHQTGRSTFLWDIEPESYGDVAGSAMDIADHVAERVQPGSIILLHVMYNSRHTSREAIPLIVKRLRKEGYRFVTLQALMAMEAEAARI